MQTLRQFVKEVFQRANASAFSSVAIPAVGTGNLKIPAALVATCMYDTADEFAQNNPTTKLRDIRFVIYDRDVKTLAVVFLLFLLSVCLVISY